MNWINRLHAGYKLLISLAVATAVFLLCLPERMELLTRSMIGWDAFSYCLILLSWLTFFTTESEGIRNFAKGQDDSRVVIFGIVVVSTIASLVAVLILLNNKDAWLLNKNLETLIYILGVAGAWILLHTIFTLRYAHMYYGDDEETPDTHAEGLEIPDEKSPDYLDFAYFSFVIGMTFQVSDIQITARGIRRLVLLHGFLSFVFNTVIVALTINVIVNMK